MSVITKILPQLYRFCFLMTGDEGKAQTAFQETVRAAADNSEEGEPAHDRFWFFRQARWRCLAVSEHGIQAEEMEMETQDISAEAPAQVSQLEVQQLAIWISGAPDPQRSALALYYLDEFNYRELLTILELKVSELSGLLARGRREFQAWLECHAPILP